MVGDALARIFAVFPSAKRAGAGWVHRCPGHDDEHESFSFGQGERGVVYKCHAGCDRQVIATALAAAGLMPAMLFDDYGENGETQYPQGNGSGNGNAASAAYGMPARKRSPKGGPWRMEEIEGWTSRETIYTYREANGDPRFIVVRGRTEYGAKWFGIYRPTEDGLWAKGLDKVKPCLYRLPELATAGSRFVFVVEGEKAADALVEVGLIATTSPFGAGKWRQHYSESLLGLNVVVLPDNDDQGRVHGYDVLHSTLPFTVAEGGSLRLVELEGLPVKGDVVDWLKAGGTAERLMEIVMETPEWFGSRRGDPAPPGGNANADVEVNPKRAIIDCDDRNLVDISAEAMAALVEAGRTYRNGVLCRVAKDMDGCPYIDAHDANSLCNELAIAALWVHRGKNGMQKVFPPVELAAKLLRLPDWDVPGLIRVTDVPLFGADGTLSLTPGYHAPSRAYYSPRQQFPDISMDPSSADIARAVCLLRDELLADFPFADEASRAHAIAMAITPFVRDLVKGPTPFFVVDAPVQGTGKTKLAEILAHISSPKTAMLAPTGDDEEWRKKITSTLVAGKTFVIIDNLTKKLSSPSLASLATGLSWSDRLLGSNQLVDVPVKIVVAITCNNGKLSTDLARRSVWIRLDARTEEPWTRSGWRHPLPRWSNENRGLLVWAILVMVLAWERAGCPVPPVDESRVFGSFEAWVDVLGGILSHCGVAGFLQNREALMLNTDDEIMEWRGFVEAWRELHGFAAVTSGELYALAEEIELFQQCMGDGNDRSRRTRFGGALSRMCDRWFGAVRIEKTSILRGQPRYRLNTQ